MQFLSNSETRTVRGGFGPVILDIKTLTGPLIYNPAPPEVIDHVMGTGRG